MNLIKRNQIDHDDGATGGQNGGTHWHIIQRMLLRLQLTACQSKNERELKKAKDYGQEWKKRYFELKSVADKMMEQFEHESAVQKSIIGPVKKNLKIVLLGGTQSVRSWQPIIVQHWLPMSVL